MPQEAWKAGGTGRKVSFKTSPSNGGGAPAPPPDAKHHHHQAPSQEPLRDGSDRPEDDDASVYLESDGEDAALPGQLDAVAERTVMAKWTQVLYKRPIMPIEGAGRHCPPPMTATSLTAFSKYKKLVLFGGMMDRAPTNETWVYDVHSRKWYCLQEHLKRQTHRYSQHAGGKAGGGGGGGAGLQDVQTPSPRCGHQTVLVNDRVMILFGGADVSISKYYNDLWSFDIETLQWTMIEAGGVKPRPRWVFAMAAIEERVYIHGGESPEYEVLGDLQVYDHDPYGELNCHVPSHAEPFAEANEARDAFLDDAKRPQGELARRGFSLVDVAVSVSTSPQCIVLKLTVNTRLSQTDLPKLQEAAAAVLDLQIADMWNVTPAMRRWLSLRTIEPSPLPRMMHHAVTVKDRIVLVGGSGGLEQTTPADSRAGGAHATWILDARCLLWRQVTTPMDMLTPFHVSREEIGTLTGHVAAAFDNCVIVHGGKLNGRVLGDNLWLFDVVAGRWSSLDVHMPEGVKLDDKGTYPNTRWKHAVTAIVDVDHTSLMRNARTITPGPYAYPLGDERDLPQLRVMLAQERAEHDRKYKYSGLLASSGNVPHIVSTQCIILWGGQSQARKCSDLWQLTLLRDDE
eukprot:TRINITY_DN1306_c2_g2_i1.p1 TRINITY_DN1306_c2_g2~~TRINITY_DN1306_c2_g2_i1.p1  ORF type:complete len:626 (+),score=249.66 TRINITY_DN1306_c2_g2_i1:134-2011(+)